MQIMPLVRKSHGSHSFHASNGSRGSEALSGSIASVGWVLPAAAGESDVRTVRERPVASRNELLEREGLPHGSVKNLGRFPDSAKDICAACAIALRVAGLRRGRETQLPVGMVVAGFERTLDVNREFFRDYVDSGRSAGRGNLFIYTLPTSPVAEASILFGMEGPLLYVEAAENPFGAMLQAAEDMMKAGQADSMAVLWQDRETTLCALLGESPGLDAGAIGRVAETWRTPSDGVQYFRARCTS
jgi:hypothetical protein